MPEKIKLADGSEREVLTEAEVASLKEAQTKVAEKDKEIAELKEYSHPPKDLRERIEILKKEKEEAETRIKALEATGKTIDPKTGAVVDHKPTLTADEIRAEQKRATQEVLVENEINRQFSQIPEDKRELVRKTFNKLVAGEQLTQDMIENLVTQAYRAAIGSTREFNPIAQAGARTSGGIPNFEKPSESFADSEEGKREANIMGLSFARIPKKK